MSDISATLNTSLPDTADAGLENISETRTADVQSAAEILRGICERFEVFREGKPLAIGIHKAVAIKMPELSALQLRAAMRRHTASTRYLKAVSQGGARFDLEMQQAGEITEEQMQQAAESLKDRFRKGAERRKAEVLAERERLKAAREQERAAAREREHQEKLAQLAQKFSRRS